MLIPFTVPQMRELDALPSEQRRQVLARYARSTAPSRIIRVVKIIFFAAVLFLCLGISVQGSLRLNCILASVLSFVGGIVYYRLSATRAIRSILRGNDHENTPEA